MTFDSSTAQLVIIFCHGAWHDVKFFDKVIALLEPLGYKCVTVPMPSVGRSKPVENLDEDIDAVRKAVLKELDAGQNVMVNAHSMYFCPSSMGMSKTYHKTGWGGLPVSLSLLALSFANPVADPLLGVQRT